MNSPVWDGDGKDPWLPTRLNALLEAAAAERQMYEAVWDALVAWLVSVKRALMRGPVMQPEAVFSRAPAWADAVDVIIETAIKPIMARAYDKLFGPDFRWQDRPNVIAYLAQVKNRMVNTPQEVFDLVAGQIAAGVTLGEGMPELSARVDDVLSTTDTARWPNRATVVARTETLGALNGSRTDAFQAAADEQPDTPMERMWLSTIDTRTRPTHVVADGQRVGLTEPFMVGGFPLAFPGDPAGPPQEVIQCVPADTRIEAGSVRAVTRRWFEGEMVRIRWASGDELTITPNHPILRADGEWTPAGLINKGDYCVSSDFGGFAVGQPYKYAVPPKIGEIYRAARELQTPNRVPLSPPDFHGDGTDGEVEVVSVNGDLGVYGETASEEQIRQTGFSLSDLAAIGASGGDDGTFTLGISWREVHSLPTPFRVRWSSHTSPFILRHRGHTEDVCLAPGAPLEAELIESPGDNRPTYAHGPCDAEHAFAVGVALTEVIEIERFDFRGHVFNLDTGVGWYTANGITVRNCRCTTVLLEVGETVDLSNRQLKKEQ